MKAELRYSCECKHFFRDYVGKEARRIRKEIETSERFKRQLKEDTDRFWARHKSLAYWERRKNKGALQ